MSSHHTTTRPLAVGMALAAALLLIAAAQAARSSPARARSDRALVALRKTGLGPVLVDARGRTLYLFEKDHNGVSMCNSACAKFWPRLVSRGTPRAGKGVHQSLLRLTRARNGVAQVSYARHPLYAFVGDKRPGRTSGRKVERSEGTGRGSGSGGGYCGSGGGW
jgi:predicted lipoprotein with Yx(FWY)xxD motif